MILKRSFEGRPFPTAGSLWPFCICKKRSSQIRINQNSLGRATWFSVTLMLSRLTTTFDSSLQLASTDQNDYLDKVVVATSRDW